MTLERGRYYTPEGLLRSTTANKSKPGEQRAIRSNDALKLGLYPSVSMIIGQVLRKPVLEEWKADTAIDAALTLPRLEGETSDAFRLRVKQDAEEQSIKARDAGTEIHASIQCWLTTGDFQCLPQWWPVVEKFILWYRAKGFEHEAVERVVVNHEFRYAGTTDWVGTLNGKRLYIDFKTQEAPLTPYDELPLQLAAYAKADDALSGCDLASVIIDRKNPGEVLFKVWGENERHWARFHCLLNYWQLSHKGWTE